MTSKLITYNLKLKTGFTLIELLVVISIMGVIMSVSLFALQGARISSRDARRKADLELIRSGLEIYKSDCNDYPPTLNWGGSLTGSCPTSNTYIFPIPKDPLSPVRDYHYSKSGSTYTLSASLEVGGTYVVSNP